MPRHLVLVLGDQLDRSSAAFDGFDSSCDMVWMAEVAGESTHVWSHKARIAVFLAAMRHFRDALARERISVDYTELTAEPRPGAPTTLAAALERSIARLREQQSCPERLVVVEPGEWRVRQALVATAEAAGIPLEVRPDRHFFSSPEEFAAHAKSRSTPRPRRRLSRRRARASRAACRTCGRTSSRATCP